MPTVRDSRLPGEHESVHAAELPPGVVPAVAVPFRRAHAPSRDAFEWTSIRPTRFPWLRLPWLYFPSDEERACVKCTLPYPCPRADEPSRWTSCQY
jgi:hypothetical protein